MVYMSGGGLQIFSLMIVFQLIKGAIAGMMAVNTSAPAVHSSESELLILRSRSVRAARKRGCQFSQQAKSSATEFYHSESRALLVTRLAARARLVQMPYYGLVTDTRERLAGLQQATNSE